jgi:dTDP-glucose 4,6-dehydratase
MGFIGSNFIRFIQNRKENVSVVNLDSMSYGSNSNNLRSINDSLTYHFVKGSTSDRRMIKELVGDIDVVVNFAAETHVDRSIVNPISFFESNAVGTLTLLDHVRKTGARFVQISTDEVYGQALNLERFTEENRLSPSSPYAASKAAADLTVEAFHKTYGLHTTILRCTNNFGPYQFPEKFIPKAIISAIIGRKISIYGDGMQVRDWTYVSDFCYAVELAIENGASGAIYNVSTGNEVVNQELAKRILARLNKPEALLEFVEDRPAHDVRYSLDSSKIRDELGWKPTKSFGDALNETIAWYVENEEWWRPLLSDRILSPTPWKEKWDNLEG